MANEWILDVLTDLRNFAIKNDLPRLSEGLSDVSRLAAAEMAIEEKSVPPLLERDGEFVGRFYGADGSRRNAGGSH